MAEIVLKDLGHSYLPRVTSEDDYALKPVNLTWEDGKTYALLGPSGCGKTTMLNIISGLLNPSEGQLLFDGTAVTERGTAERNIAQVFQFPVIYTTKTVAKNLAFPLECRGWDPRDISKRVAEVAALLDLTDILDSPARTLSADQKQLISLGRGLVRDDVSAVLLDEPLTVIDPQMKFALRRKLREINRRTGTTMILVTHDQSEAMSFADEVVVMRDGRVQQAGPPEQLFETPENTFVGYFIGSPPINLLSTSREQERLLCPALNQGIDAVHLPTGGELQFGLRPEHVTMQMSPSEGPQAQVDAVENLGIERVFTLRTKDGEVLKAKSRRHHDIRVGDSIGISTDPEKLLLYRNESLLRL